MATPTFRIATFVLLAGAVWAIYGRAVDAPFVFDDPFCIADNPSVVRLWPWIGDSQQPGPLNPPADLPTSGRPLVNLSMAVNFHFGQLNPVGYHVFNLIVHLLSALLLMGIVERTLRLEFFAGRFHRASCPLALMVALLWTVHPLQTETVVYITQRTELMVGFFYFATLYASLRYWAAESAAARNTWVALAALACLAGMACKEVMVTAPVIVLLYERTFLRGSFRRALRKSWPLYAGLFLGWGLLLYLNVSGPRSLTAGFHLNVPAHVWWLTQTKVLLMYLKLAVWPWPLSIHYEFPYLQTLGAAGPWLVLSSLAAIATLYLLWRRSAIGFVGAWILLILSPTLVVPIITEVAAERRMYLPLAALATLLVVGGYWLIRQATSTRATAARIQASRWREAPAAAVGLLLVMALSVVSVRRLAIYHDELTLWRDNVIHQPDDPVSYYNLGHALVQADQPQEAIEPLEHALRLRPNFADAHNNLGIALARADRIPEGLEQFQLALKLKPDSVKAHLNFGAALGKAGRLDEAIAQLQEAARLQPDSVDAYANLTKAYALLQQPTAAISAAEKALALAQASGKTIVAGQIEDWLKNYRAQQEKPRDKASPLPGAAQTP